MKELALLPVGQQDFSEIRKLNMVYVDKTQYIHKLLLTRAPFWFLAHPRRFGKSLLINTLKELFLGKKELFKGLYIEDKMEWEEFPVIHLDFSNMGFRSIGLELAISNRLQEIGREYDVNLEKTGNDNLFQELIQKLYEKTGKQVVILIDEYDKPITDVLEISENKKTHEHRDILRTFYSTIKGSSLYIRFFFLTGIARFSKVSIFSELNNLTDLTFHDDYHNLLGYTQEEIQKYFTPHLEVIAEKLKITMPELLAQVKMWYNGYSWNGNDRVYNPYSILRFLDAKSFRNFWFDSGTPKFLIKLLKDKMIYDISEMTVSVSETDNFDIDNLGLETLLFQTGYLTIKEADDFGSYILTYPNKEVEHSMMQYILTAFAQKNNSLPLATSIAKGVKNNDFEQIIKGINSILRQFLTKFSTNIKKNIFIRYFFLPSNYAVFTFSLKFPFRQGALMR